MNKKTNSVLKIICLIRKASFNYFLKYRLDAGIVLKVTEIKDLNGRLVRITI